MRAVRASRGAQDCTDSDDDERVIALNALMQMDAERAMPLLKKVMARRDKCSEILRRKAVFLIAQKRTDEAADILVDAARNDPDAEVREQAVQWLSRVPARSRSASSATSPPSRGTPRRARRRCSPSPT